MNPLTLRLIVFQVLVLLAAAFGILAWVARPEGALIWLAGMMSLPIAWLVLRVTGKMPPTDCPAERQTALNSLIGSGLIIAGALGACTLGSMGVIDASWIVRYAMITNALILVVVGNGLPKKIEPGRSRSRALGIQRLLGWSFVLAGIALSIIWLLPTSEDLARNLSVVIYAGIAAITLFGTFRRHGLQHKVTG